MAAPSHCSGTTLKKTYPGGSIRLRQKASRSIFLEVIEFDVDKNKPSCVDCSMETFNVKKAEPASEKDISKNSVQLKICLAWFILGIDMALIYNWHG